MDLLRKVFAICLEGQLFRGFIASHPFFDDGSHFFKIDQLVLERFLQMLGEGGFATKGSALNDLRLAGIPCTKAAFGCKCPGI